MPISYETKRVLVIGTVLVVAAVTYLHIKKKRSNDGLGQIPLHAHPSYFRNLAIEIGRAHV